MHLAYFCLCGVLDDFSIGLIDFLLFLTYSLIFICELFDIVCISNRIAYIRLRGIALLDIYDVSFNSISGLLARSTGLL
jgi:NADH:ubiquinone oxidoreductase subunit D